MIVLWGIGGDIDELLEMLSGHLWWGHGFRGRP
jgi:hypothetical protein